MSKALRAVAGVSQGRLVSEMESLHAHLDSAKDSQMSRVKDQIHSLTFDQLAAMIDPLARLESRLIRTIHSAHRIVHMIEESERESAQHAY